MVTENTDNNLFIMMELQITDLLFFCLIGVCAASMAGMVRCCL
jgi:hypothetical protein